MLKLGLNISRNTSIVLRRTMSTQDSEVLCETLNNAGIMTLNRPKALNSLNEPMVRKMLPQLQEWEKSKAMVIIKGAGDKAFCAGGDVKVAIDKVLGPRFFFAEYNVNYLIGKYKIPYIALIDGITMGGGLGVSVHGRYRVATERTVIAMPETKIGLVPDVGGSYFLPRLPVNLGLYLGLTGDRLKGQDVVKAGIATHFVPSRRLYELETLLSRCSNDMEINSLLTKFSEPPEEFSLADNIKHINYCFAASTIEEIIERLEKVQNEWSEKTIKILHQMCPGSLKITLRALQRGAQLDLGQCLKMEYRIASWCTMNNDFPEGPKVSFINVMRGAQLYLGQWLNMEYRIAIWFTMINDFPDGVRALLIEKDNKPKWTHKSIAEVTDDYVESFFKRLPDKELTFFDEASKLSQ